MDPRADRGASVLLGVVLPERYEPIRRIARGGMATVWCAQDRTLDRQVAIKLLAEPYAYDELAGRRFKREARAAARLSGHPNVVTIYDVGEAPPEDGPRGRPFLVMEYLPGGTMADALRTGQFDRLTALRWLQHAAAALDYAHRRGVIHRDVKPANFLLDRERILHVADFGIAQLGTEDTLTVSGEVLGTAAYLAPERALGQPATAASDRYALAVAAYELIVGERPFTAEHFAAQARQHLEDAPPPASRRNPDLPPALDAVLERGMAKRAEDRFPTCLQLTDEIEAALLATGATRPVAPTQRTRAIAQPAATAARAGAAGPPVASGGRSSIPRSTRARVAVLAALAAALLGIAIAAAASGGSGSGSGGRAEAGHKTHARAKHPAPASHPSTQTSPRTTSTGAATPPAPAGGAPALEAQGHALMEQGNYRSAIPVLRRAVAAAPSSSLTYAYALYDLGRSLRLAGDPRAAVQILWRRLQIPNQTSTVRAELALALQALGQHSSQPGHHGRDGGDQGD
jgi:tRNA A-37 threonylcarbamoyl transferase component Bud32